jgi:uncharacterized protein with FMN-binding domain
MWCARPCVACEEMQHFLNLSCRVAYSKVQSTSITVLGFHAVRRPKDGALENVGSRDVTCSSKVDAVSDGTRGLTTVRAARTEVFS